MDLSLLFCGTAGSVPTARRGLPATLLRRGGDRVLFDCGEGTQRQLLRAGGLPDIDTILLTHHHADHWLGLPGMVKSFALRDRDTPLEVYGPAHTVELLRRMAFVIGTLPFELRVADLEPGEPVHRDGYAITPFAVSHRGPAFGYAIVEEGRPGRLDAEKAKSLGVADGPDLGRLTRGETVNGVTPDMVVGPARAGRKVVLSGDTAPNEMLSIAAHHADVLVHESTFLHEERERAAKTRHSTARQAAETATQAEVRLLALNHLSGRYAGRELLEEAQAVFEHTVLPRDFDTIDVPFPEKGRPELIRPERQRPAAPAEAPA